MSLKGGNNDAGTETSTGIDRRDFMKITVAGLGAVATTMTLAGCGGGSDPDPQTTFAVISDLHFYDPALGTSSGEFAAYVASDRKMIAQSEELLNAAVADILAKKPNFVLVPGDLTKDGEKQNHQQVAGILATLRNQGVKVYVIPGNHDINNPASLSYLSSPPTAIANVSPTDFKSIYSDCGYGAALAQDPNSLSYVAEPTPGLWLIAIDSCKYANNATNVDPMTGQPAPVTSGAISTATSIWITSQLSAAKQQGKTVIGMLHHGLLEHFPGQNAIFPAYLLDNWQTVSGALCAAGLNVVFTGHFHANDVVSATYSPSVLYDIETGSLVTAASPYRFVNLNLSTKTMAITTSRVAAIPSHTADFVDFSEHFLYNGLATANTGLVPQMLAAPTSYGGFGLPISVANSLAPLVAYALMVHYYGDEKAFTNPAATSQITVSGVPLATYAAGVWATLNDTTDPGAQFRTLIGGIWNDTAPPDNNLTFTLGTTNVVASLYRKLFMKDYLPLRVA